MGLKILSQARWSSTVDGGEVISEIEASTTMYTLFHVKNCFNNIILLLLENSINRYFSGGEGGISLLTEAKQKGTVHRSVPQVLFHYLSKILQSRFFPLSLYFVSPNIQQSLWAILLVRFELFSSLLLGNTLVLGEMVIILYNKFFFLK